MKDEYFDYTNSDAIQERIKDGLLERSKYEILNQDQHDENYKIVKWIIDCLLERNIIKYRHLLDWRNQTGEVQEKAVEILFRIQKQFDGITLTDEEFTELTNFCAVMYGIKLNNFESFTQAIQGVFAGAIVVYDNIQKTMFIFLDLSDNILRILQGIIYYKLFPAIPVSSYCLVKKQTYETTYDATAMNPKSRSDIFKDFSSVEEKYCLPTISAEDMYYC